MTWVMPIVWCLTTIVVIASVVGIVAVIMALLAMRNAAEDRTQED